MTNVWEAICCYPSSRWAKLNHIASHLSPAGAHLSTVTMAQPSGSCGGCESLSSETDLSILASHLSWHLRQFPSYCHKAVGISGIVSTAFFCLVREIMDIEVEETSQQTSPSPSKPQVAIMKKTPPSPQKCRNSYRTKEKRIKLLLL